MKSAIQRASAFGILLFCMVATARCDILDTWVTNQITTNFAQLHHVVYGNGHYVAVAEYSDGGDIYSSEDGIHWTLRFSDLNSWGVELNFSAGHFAGVSGFGFVDVSADATNWTSTMLPTFDFDEGPAVTYGHGVYVAVGEYNGVGTIQTSPDDLSWTLRSISGGAGGPIVDVAYGPRGFVAIGNNDGLEYYSLPPSAGTNWVKGNIPGGNKISYANGLYIVPLNNKTNLISADGRTWDSRQTGLTNLLGKVAYINSLFMAQCGISYSNSFLATSVDGTNWVQYQEPLPNNWNSPGDLPDPDVSMATDGTRLVVVGASGTIFSANSFIYTSDVLVGIRMTNAPLHQLALSGLVGRHYQIQSSDTLTGSLINWRTNLYLQLPQTPYVWSDATATNPARFYRGVLMP